MPPARLLRVTVSGAAFLLGSLFAVGAALGILFEVQGFGTPPGAPRRGYIVGQAAQLLASLVVPLVVLRLAFPRAARWWLPAVGVALGAAVAVGVLGLSMA